GFSICEHRIALQVDEAPSFEIKAPTKISFKRTQWSWEDFPLDITNDMTNELIVHINVTAKETDLNYIRDLIVAGNSEERTNLPISFMRSDDEPSYFEEITINIQTTSGIYEFILSVQVQNKQAVTSTDLFVTLAICAPIILVLFIAILAIIYGKTKVTIELYLKKNEPLELGLTFFKKRAIKDLAQQYLVEENWQVGLLLAETYDQDYSKQYNKIKARDLIITGQDKLNQGLLQDGLDFWLKARKSLEIIGDHELLDTLDFQLQPLERIVEAVFAKKADEKASSLQKEFNNLSSMKTQRKSILGVAIDIPL
ncbi:MAG: hypothetical protein ACTSPT_01515, partial [Candidatus Heimdallarchaeota archaeon]